MATAGTLDATLHVKLKAELQAILDQIGTGWADEAGPTRHWPPLPSCDPRVTGRVGADAIWNGQEDVMTLITTAIKEIHPPGGNSGGRADKALLAHNSRNPVPDRQEIDANANS
jgi:hypothetical protein